MTTGTDTRVSELASWFAGGGYSVADVDESEFAVFSGDGRTVTVSVPSHPVSPADVERVEERHRRLGAIGTLWLWSEPVLRAEEEIEGIRLMVYRLPSSIWSAAVRTRTAQHLARPDGVWLLSTGLVIDEGSRRCVAELFVPGPRVKLPTPYAGRVTPRLCVQRQEGPPLQPSEMDDVSFAPGRL